MDVSRFNREHPAFAAGVKEVLTNSNPLVPGGAIIFNEGSKYGSAIDFSDNPPQLRADVEEFVTRHPNKFWVLYERDSEKMLHVAGTLKYTKEDGFSFMLGKQGPEDDKRRKDDEIGSAFNY